MKDFVLKLYNYEYSATHTGISGENSDDEGEEEEIHFDLTQQIEAHNEEGDGSDDDYDDGDVVIVRKKKLKVIEDSESDDESDENIAGNTCDEQITIEID